MVTLGSADAIYGTLIATVGLNLAARRAHWVKVAVNQRVTPAV